MLQYQLTDSTRETATQLVEAWDSDKLSQKFTIQYIQGDDTIRGAFIFADKSELDITPSPAVWDELNKFDLVIANETDKYKYDITILKELQHAVYNDFHLSPYALAKTGSSADIADHLRDILANQIASNNELAKAINDLASSEDKPNAVGKIINQLGNSLGHGANTVTISQGILTLATWLAMQGY